MKSTQALGLLLGLLPPASLAFWHARLGVKQIAATVRASLLGLLPPAPPVNDAVGDDPWLPTLQQPE